MLEMLKRLEEEMPADNDLDDEYGSDGEDNDAAVSLSKQLEGINISEQYGPVSRNMLPFGDIYRRRGSANPMVIAQQGATS